MRRVTEKLGKLLCRDGPMLLVSTIFTCVYFQNMGAHLA